LRLGARRGWLLGAAVLYVASLWLPAIEGPGFPAQSGLDVLRQGATAWRELVFAWYANPALWLALVLGWIARRRAALACAALGLALALSSLTAGFAAELAGRSVPAFGFGVGFYVWLGAFVLALIGLRRD
jgi:hypothetical protein